MRGSAWPQYALLDVMGERGDIVVPDFEGAGGARWLAVVQGALAAARTEAYSPVAGGTGKPWAFLAAAQYLASLPDNAHEAVTAVARQLRVDSKLLAYGRVQETAEPDHKYRAGFGCGCRIELGDGDCTLWAFHRKDDAWCGSPTATAWSSPCQGSAPIRVTWLP
jgi:hypothetical protein